jgi:hypothetical protein
MSVSDNDPDTDPTLLWGSDSGKPAATKNDPASNPAGEKRAVIAAPAAGALASATSIKALLSKVDTSGTAGRSGPPTMLFKSRTDSGIYTIGQKRTIPEEHARWAVNPTTFQWGYICFNDDNRPTERLVPVTQPKPDLRDLPDLGFKWQDEKTVNMQCLDGIDAGVEVIFKATTFGAIKVLDRLIDDIRDRPDDNIVAIVKLSKEVYPHKQYGPVAEPILVNVGWMPLGGPAPAPAPAPQPTPPASPSGSSSPSSAAAPEQPRRRRVA